MSFELLSDDGTWLSTQTMLAVPDFVSNTNVSVQRARPAHAWCAGLFDAHGWIRVEKVMAATRMSYKLVVYIHTPNKYRALEIVGMYGGREWPDMKRKGAVWTVSGPGAIRFLKQIQQHVRWKRKAISTAMRFVRWKERTNWRRKLGFETIAYAEEIRLTLANRKMDPELVKSLARGNVADDIARIAQKRAERGPVGRRKRAKYAEIVTLQARVERVDDGTGAA